MESPPLTGFTKQATLQEKKYTCQHIRQKNIKIRCECEACSSRTYIAFETKGGFCGVQEFPIEHFQRRTVLQLLPVSEPEMGKGQKRRQVCGTGNI